MTTPAEELTAAARRLRSGMLIARADLDMPLAAWLEEEAGRLAATATPFWQEAVGGHPLAVARAINGGQP